MVNVTQSKAQIFRITHIDNVPQIIEHGLHCRNTCPAGFVYRDIGNQDLIEKRRERPVLIYPHGTLSDYIPFYFTPFSPMLLNIKTGYGGVRQIPMSEIAIVVTSLHRLIEQRVPFVFTDRHAKLETADFCSDLKDLSRLPWKLWQQRDFKIDPNKPDKKERYQAEALVYRHLPTEALLGIVCYGEPQCTKPRDAAAKFSKGIPVVANPGMYF